MVTVQLLQEQMRVSIFKSLQKSWEKFLHCNKQTVIEWKCLLCKQLSSRVLIQNCAELVPCFPATKHSSQSPENLTNVILMNIKAYLHQPQKCWQSRLLWTLQAQMKYPWINSTDEAVMILFATEKVQINIRTQSLLQIPAVFNAKANIPIHVLLFVHFMMLIVCANSFKNLINFISFYLIIRPAKQFSLLASAGFYASLGSIE